MAKESYWLETTKNIGKVKEDTKVLVDFQHIEDMPEFKAIQLSCGCTTVEKFVGNTLTVKLHVKKFPPHLHGSKSSEILKRIKIVYKNGSEEILTITGTRVR